MKPCKTVLLATLLLMNGSAHALELSAGIREYYSSLNKNGYSSDGATKLKMGITDLGVGSVTLNLRIAAMSPRDSSLYLPVLRSDQNSVETMVSRIIHGNALPVLKPMILINPGVGTPSGIPEMNPGSGKLLLSSYQQVLASNLPILTLKSVKEFVLGAGMGMTYGKEYSESWMAILSNFRQRSNSNLDLSLELSNENALVQLESFKSEDPGAFFDTWGGIDKIRFTLPIEEYLDRTNLVIQKEKLSKLLLDRLSRIHSLLPNRKIGLSNLILPACFNYTSNESEVECPGVDLINGMGFTKEGEQAQLKMLQDFFEVIDHVQLQTGSALQSIELTFASTQDEPFEADADPRFPFYNPNVKAFLKDRLHSDNHHSTEVTSLPRASLEDFSGADEGKKRACIYFDELNAKDALGAIHARMLENLIGAFPDWRRERRSIQFYRTGDLLSCDTIFYLASNFVLEPPAAFYPDLVEFAQHHTLTWFNYKFDHFAEASADYARRHPGASPVSFHVPYMIQPDRPPTYEIPDPGFFRYFDYKGETFEKLARYDPMTKLYSNSPELGGVQIQDPSKVQVLSYARHSKTDQKTPYVVEQKLGDAGSLYYFADLPFSFGHYEDRYFIFSDLIYDILKEKTPDRPPVALVRLEDINPSDSISSISWATDYLADHHIPFSMAMIPYYSNLFEDPIRGVNEPVWKPADQYPEFLGAMKYAKARGADFVVHGLAHQAGDLISGFSGSTGSDYEFWSWPANLPHPQDRPEWVLQRLELAKSVVDRMGIKPLAWEVPHYAGSALDFVLFGKLFEWNYHRGIYFKSEIREDAPITTQEEIFNCNDRECRDQRSAALSHMKVEADYKTFGSQIFPYPIFKDSYGQAIIPETLGMIDFAFYSPGTWRPVSFTEDLLRRAKKLRVIRGAMASFFWHPILLNQDNRYYQEKPGSFEQLGGTQTLIQMVEGLKALGYEFKSISDCKLFPRRACGSNEGNREK